MKLSTFDKVSNPQIDVWQNNVVKINVVADTFIKIYSNKMWMMLL
jgi:hypothetical protein